jgi:hypothetical protein
MKKTFLLLVILLITIQLQAIVSKTVNCTAGNLSTLLTATEKSTITNLTLTGTVDARDFRIMRDSMGVLAEINLSSVDIEAYYGNDGTAGLYVSYPEDEFPEMAFKNIYDNTQFKLSLISIVLPSSITAIGSYAFNECRNLTSIIIPPLVKVVDMEAFRRCIKLVSVFLPSSLTTIGQLAFNNCSELTTINLPSTISYIGYGAFSSCYKMNDIVIPDLITIIFGDTFLSCRSFTSVTIPSNIDSIGSWAFGICNSLKTVTIMEGVKYLGEYSFMASDSLNTVTIPSSVKSIGYLAFAGNTRMKSIYVHSFIPIPLGTTSKVFNDINKTTCTLYVPLGSKTAYQSASQWKDFVNIIEVPGLYASETDLNFRYIGGNQNITINSTAAWSAVTNEPWITVTPNSGILGRTTVTVATSVNTGAKRTGSITFSAPGIDSQVVTVIQDGPIITFPWNEGFENQGIIPSEWKQEQVNNSGIYWKFLTGNNGGHPGSSHGGIYNACLIDFSSGDNKTRLISPMINLNVIDDPILSFWHTQQAWGSDQDRLIVYYKTSIAGAWTQLAIYTSNITNWTQETINLLDSSSEYYICFEGNAKYGYGVCIDDVSITGTPKIQPNIAIINETVSNGETPCFNAYDTITVAGDGAQVEFLDGSSVELIAGQTILLLPGFRAYEGSIMHASITTNGTFCDGATGTIVQNSQTEKSGNANIKPNFEPASGSEKVVKVYPNPNNGNFTIKFSNLISGTEIRVFNALGATVYHSVIREENQQKVSLSGVRKGFYFVKITDGKEQFARKMVVE